MANDDAPPDVLQLCLTNAYQQVKNLPQPQRAAVMQKQRLAVECLRYIRDRDHIWTTILDNYLRPASFSATTQSPRVMKI